MKPCPFCSGVAKGMIDTSAGMWFTQCLDCKVRTRLFPTLVQAEAAWNERKRPSRAAKIQPAESLPNPIDVEHAAMEKQK